MTPNDLRAYLEAASRSAAERRETLEIRTPLGNALVNALDAYTLQWEMVWALRSAGLDASVKGCGWLIHFW